MRLVFGAQFVFLCLMAGCGGTSSGTEPPLADSGTTDATDTGIDSTVEDSAVEAAADAQPESACVADFAVDPEHCGRCNHSCLGGTCVDGQCQAFSLGKTKPRAHALALDSTHLYWVTYQSNTVERMPLVGGNVTVLASGLANPFFIAVANASVYWAGGAGVGLLGKVPVQGGESVTLASNTGDLSGIAVDDAWVYSATGDKVVKVSVQGGSLETVASGLANAGLLALHGSDLYAYASDGLWKVAKAGGEPTLVFGHPQPAGDYAHAVDFDGDEIIWGGNNGIYRFANGIQKKLAPAHNTYYVIVGTEYVYWSESGNYDPANEDFGAVKRVAKDGGTPLAVDPDPKHPNAMIADSTAIYWSDNEEIMKLAQ